MKNLSGFMAEELIIVPKVLDFAPFKVRTSEGLTYYFISYKSDDKRVTGGYRNPSATSIKAYLELHALTSGEGRTWRSRVPVIEGIVSEDGLIAGILITYVT